MHAFNDEGLKEKAPPKEVRKQWEGHPPHILQHLHNRRRFARLQSEKYLMTRHQILELEKLAYDFQIRGKPHNEEVLDEVVQEAIARGSYDVHLAVNCATRKAPQQTWLWHSVDQDIREFCRGECSMDAMQHMQYYKRNAANWNIMYKKALEEREDLRELLKSWDGRKLFVGNADQFMRMTDPP